MRAEPPSRQAPHQAGISSCRGWLGEFRRQCFEVYKPRPFEDLQTGPGTAAGYRPAAADERHPATMSDNPALLRVNPEYLAWLLSLPTLELERLLAGDWKIRPAAGLYFKRDWCSVVDQAPADLDIVRYSDLAVTKKPSSATGLSASSSVAIGAAAIGRWIWCGRAPTRATSNSCCSIPPRRTASGSRSR